MKLVNASSTIPAPAAGIVSDALADQHLVPVEEMGIPMRVEDAAVSLVRDRVGLEHRALSLGERLALEQYPLLTDEHRRRVGPIPGRLIARAV